MEVDTHPYSILWRLIGETVTVQVRDDQVSLLHISAEVARHVAVAGRRQRVVEPAHLTGIIGARGGRRAPAPEPHGPAPVLLRPLAD